MMTQYRSMLTTYDNIVYTGTCGSTLALTPDERYLMTTNGISNDLSIIDVATLKVINTIQVGQQPWGIAISEH